MPAKFLKDIAPPNLLFRMLACAQCCCYMCHSDNTVYSVGISYCAVIWVLVKQVTEPTVGEKRCSECGQDKPASHFYKNRTNKDGLFGKCKLCSEGTKKERALNEVTVDSKASSQLPATKSAFTQVFA